MPHIGEHRSTFADRREHLEQSTALKIAERQLEPPQMGAKRLSTQVANVRFAPAALSQMQTFADPLLPPESARRFRRDIILGRLRLGIFWSATPACLPFVRNLAVGSMLLAMTYKQFGCAAWKQSLSRSTFDVIYLRQVRIDLALAGFMGARTRRTRVRHSIGTQPRSF